MRIRTARTIRPKSLEGLVLVGVNTLEVPPCERMCESCGKPFMGSFLPWLQRRCALCVAEAVRLSQEQARDSREEERRREVERMGLKGRLAQMSLAGFAREYQRQAFDATQEFCLTFPAITTLVLLGKPGCGKTHLACGALLELAKTGFAGRYVHLPTVTADLRAASGSDSWQTIANREFGPMRRADCLVLDDFGRHKDSDAIREQIDAVIDRRWVEGAPMIITANLERAEFYAALNEANASRLSERSRLVACTDYDWRLQPGRAPVVPKEARDVRTACSVCRGAGWVLNEAAPAGRADRLRKCPACDGRQW